VRGSCMASQRKDLMATGYVTVDVVNSCSPLNPSSPGYFVAGGKGVAANDNVLLGEYSYVDSRRKTAEGEQAVHIAADATAFASGYTFYGRYVNGDGRDNRQPLGVRFAATYAQDAKQGMATDLIIWRDTKSAGAAPGSPQHDGTDFVGRAGGRDLAVGLQGPLPPGHPEDQGRQQRAAHRQS